MLSGVQGGKTTCGAAWEIAQWCRQPKSDHLILAPTYKLLKQATLRKLETMMLPDWATYNGQDSCYWLRSGGVAWCRSTEDPDCMEGITASSVWLDEAGQMPVAAWDNALGRRSATEGPMFLTTTPYGRNWLKTRFYDQWLAGLPEYRVVKFSSIDSPFFSKATWEQAHRDMPPGVFARKFCASFERLEGLIYSDFELPKMGMEPFQVSKEWQRIGGIDFGYADGHPFAASVWASPNFFDEKKPIVKVGEHKRSRTLLSGHIAAMRSIEERVGPVSVWYADPSAAQQIAELRNAGIRISGAINDVEWGICAVVKLMRNARYRIVQKWCPQTIDELEMYHWDEDDKIVKENDHLMDADRYALATHTRRRTGVQIA